MLITDESVFMEGAKWNPKLNTDGAVATDSSSYAENKMVCTAGFRPRFNTDICEWAQQQQPKQNRLSTRRRNVAEGVFPAQESELEPQIFRSTWRQIAFLRQSQRWCVLFRGNNGVGYLLAFNSWIGLHKDLPHEWWDCFAALSFCRK